MFKISFCTVSMNRLDHIKATFLKNIVDNIDYPHLEFNLLDYNSSDGLESWAKSELEPYIKTGLVKFYKTDRPVHFQRSHSRNVVFRLATGDIICNLDADNFTGVNFAHYINRVLYTSNDFNESFLMPARELTEESDRNSYGRIVVSKQDFIKINGFDERMDGYGFEDTDFINRLMRLGCKPHIITDRSYLRGISHSQALRISEERYFKSISSILIAQIHPYESRVLFLFKNNQFKYTTLLDRELMESLCLQFGVLLDKGSVYKYPIEFKSGAYYGGMWQYQNDSLQLQFEDDNKRLFLKYIPGIDMYENTDGNENFFPVRNSLLTENLIYLVPQIANRNYMNFNMEYGDLVNKEGYGKGLFYCNFNPSPIEII